MCVCVRVRGCGVYECVGGCLDVCVCVCAQAISKTRTHRLVYVPELSGLALSRPKNKFGLFLIGWPRHF